MRYSVERSQGAGYEGASLVPALSGKIPEVDYDKGDMIRRVRHNDKLNGEANCFIGLEH